MIDYFSEQLSEMYIRGAVLFAVVSGVAELFMIVRAPELFPWWGAVEGVLVIALAYGVWRRILAAAVTLLALKTIVLISLSLQANSAPRSTAVIQIASYGLATAAIALGAKSRARRSSEEHVSIPSGPSHEPPPG